MNAWSAAATGHRRGHLPVERSVGQSAIGAIAAGHASLLWELRLEGRAALSESHSLYVSGRRDWERRCGRRLVSRGAALAGQGSVTLVRGGVAAVHRVPVQTGATLRYGRVVSQNGTALTGMCE